MIPIGDSPNPRGVPVVNYLLIATNVAVFFFVTWPLSARAANLHDPATREYLELLYQVFGQTPDQLSAYDIFLYTHGFRPVAPSWTGLFYSMFLHAGIGHLAGNMLFLWIYGDNVEHRLGHIGYLLAYLATGAAATGTHALLSPEPWFPVVGASGAISGVMGFYFVWFPRNVVRIFVFLFPIFVDVVTLPARWVLGFYLVVDNLLPFLFQSGSGGVALGAHIGGFVGGVVLAILLRRYNEYSAVHHFEPDAERSGSSPVQEVVDASRDHRWKDAAVGLLRTPRSDSVKIPPQAWLDTAHWLAENASPEVAATAYRRYIATHPRGPDLAEAHLGLGLLHLEHGEPTTAYQYLLSALEFDPSPQVAARARAGLGKIEELQGRRRHIS